MNLSPAFFELQLQFADSIVQVSQLSFDEALLNYTNLYLQFIGRSFDPFHPIWQEYLTDLYRTSERAIWTHAFYQRRRERYSPSPYGCFHYSYLPAENTIRYHFVNTDTSGSGPLSKERMPVRLQELKTMFAEIKKRYGDTPIVRGNSWLYNIDAYKQLFPPQYTQAMKVARDEFQYMSLWGQFLQRDGQVRKHLADAFLSCLQLSETIAGHASCFPYQVLSPQSPINLFYKFYKV